MFDFQKYTAIMKGLKIKRILAPTLSQRERGNKKNYA